MSNSILNVPIIDLNAFAQDFVDYIASREGRKPPQVNLVVVSDAEWDRLLAVTAPYRRDPENVDQRVGMAYAVKRPITEREIPDLIKALFQELAKAIPDSDLIVALNQQTLTHPPENDPEQAFNAIFNRIVLLCEKALAMQGYENLNPVEDSMAFAHSRFCKPERYVK
jgi:type II secretory pathway predicted ATPase ExeA